MTRQQYTTQLDAILDMLSLGHNSVRIEAHTLPLWGIVVGLLIGFTGILADALTPELINNDQQRSIFIQTFIAIAVLLTITVDRYSIIKKRRLRDESISPLQRRINNINWLVSGSGVMIMMYADNKLTPAHDLFGMYIVLSGFCLYVFGLFSSRWYRWSGLVQVILGVCALFLFKNHAMKIYAASSFIVGGILIQLLGNDSLNTKQLLLRTATWIMTVWLVAGTAYYIHYKLYIDSGHLSIVTLSEFTKNQESTAGPVVVTIPKETEIPFEYFLVFDLFEKDLTAKWTMLLKYPVDIVIKNGQPTGIYRIDGGSWRRRRDALEVTRFQQDFFIDTNARATIHREVTIETNRKFPGLNL